MVKTVVILRQKKQKNGWDSTNEQFEGGSELLWHHAQTESHDYCQESYDKVETTTVIEGLINFSIALFQEGLERFYTTNFALVAS